MSDNRELDRLIELAKQAEPDAIQVPPYASTRVIARAWGSGNDESGAHALLIGVRWGVAFASAAMLACILLNVGALRTAQDTSESMFSPAVTELVLNQ